MQISAITQINMASETVLDIALVGDGSVGKTCYIDYILNGIYNETYVPTSGVEYYSLPFTTDTAGDIRFSCAITSDQSQCASMTYAAAMIMFDVESQSTYDSVGAWHNALIQNNPGIPVTIVGSKVDVRGRLASRVQFPYATDHGLLYYQVATKDGFNLDKPLQWLARQLLQNPDLRMSKR